MAASAPRRWRARDSTRSPTWPASHAERHGGRRGCAASAAAALAALKTPAALEALTGRGATPSGGSARPPRSRWDFHQTPCGRPPPVCGRSDPPRRPARATVRTDRGTFVWRSTRRWRAHGRQFARLARSGYFNGLAFHRVVPNFVIQDGDPRGDGWGGPGYAIPCEYNEQPYKTGTVGMALSGKDTGGSQWFVTLAPQPRLEGRYTVFGDVVSGMDLVERIMPEIDPENRRE